LDEDGETINSTDDKFMQPSDKDAQATSSQTKKSKEKGWPMFNELQAKKTASQQRNQKMNRALYLPSNPETDYVNDTMNRNK
jgi:hypothetical protein